jgi:dipeptidyl aminopeptidase/acylaminoacyl peptidase
MIRAPSTHVNRLLQLAFILIATALAACVVTQGANDVGVDAIAPDGRRANIVRYNEPPPTWRLIQLDLTGGAPITLALEISPTHSVFSPDGQNMLMRTSAGWKQITIGTGKQITITQPSENVQWLQYLPDGQLLKVTQLPDNTQLFSIIDPARPNITPSKVQVRYSFSIYRQGADALALWNNWLVNKGAKLATLCPQPQMPGQVIWAMVDNNNTVHILIATSRGSFLQPLPAKLSSRVTELLAQQENAIRPRVRAELMKKEGLSPQQLESQTDELVLQALGGLSPFSSLSPNPDLPRLLLVLVNLEDDQPLYTLYLNDLATGAEPLVLSSKTKWPPSFAFSPDGKQILYERDQNGHRTLYIADSDGAQPQLVAVDSAGACWH